MRAHPPSLLAPALMDTPYWQMASPVNVSFAIYMYMYCMYRIKTVVVVINITIYSLAQTA